MNQTSITTLMANQDDTLLDNWPQIQSPLNI